MASSSHLIFTGTHRVGVWYGSRRRGRLSRASRIKPHSSVLPRPSELSTLPKSVYWYYYRFVWERHNTCMLTSRPRHPRVQTNYVCVQMVSTFRRWMRVPQGNWLTPSCVLSFLIHIAISKFELHFRFKNFYWPLALSSHYGLLFSILFVTALDLWLPLIVYYCPYFQA